MLIQPIDIFVHAWLIVAVVSAAYVAWDQFPGRNDLPSLVAPDPCIDLQLSTQLLNDTGSSVLLRKAQHSVDNQQRANHSEIRVIPERG